MVEASKRWQQIEKLLQEQHWSEASEKLEDWYQETQTADLNYHLVFALANNHQYMRAYHYASEFQDAYLTTFEHFQLFLKVALASQALIPARKFVWRAPEAKWRDEAWAQIELTEQKVQQSQGQKLRTITKEFYHLSDASLLEQQARLAAADQLPLAAYTTGAQFLLVDPFVQPLIRVDVLTSLQGLRFQQTVNFQWLDEQNYQLVPADLEAISAQPSFQATFQALQNQVGTHDPVLLPGLQAELQLQLMYLYPFSEKVITNADDWVQLLQSNHTGQKLENLTVEQRKMLNWQIKIESFNQDLAQK